MSTQKIFGFLCFFICLPIALISQPPRIVILTDGSGRPNCDRDVEAYADTVDVSANASFCAPILISGGINHTQIHEVVTFAFCGNLLYDQLIIRTENIDQANNVLTIDLGNGNTSNYYGVWVDIDHPENSLPSDADVEVNTVGNLTEVRVEMNYGPTLVLGTNTTEITTMYRIFAPDETPGDWMKVASDTMIAPTCGGQSGGNGNNRLSQQGDHVINLFPNPAHNRLNITSPLDEILELHLLDVQGKEHFVNYLSTDPHQLTLDVANLAQGFYLLRYKTRLGWHTRKWMKN